jgi:hypothetical protein
MPARQPLKARVTPPSAALLQQAVFYQFVPARPWPEFTDLYRSGNPPSPGAVIILGMRAIGPTSEMQRCKL